MSETTGDGDGDGDGDNGDGDGDNGDGDNGDGDGDSGECFAQPPECERFIRCIGAILPEQLEAVEGQFGADGTCWCDSTQENAQGCFETCVMQLDTAIKNNPTANECHENYCTIDELDPDEPYGPPNDDDTCSPYLGNNDTPIDQVLFDGPFGVPGKFCAPQCSGIANACPDSSQTSATGTCYISQGEDSYCISRCYVDPTVVGGTQCQCGATCQPQGAPDGEGNMRGICTFE